MTDGKIDFIYGGETFQTYYKLFGDISNKSKIPVIVLHGGPGLVHNYLVAHSDLTVKHDIPVILYDQLGNGKSTHLKEKAPEFWTVDLFIAELENVINHFGIQNSFDIIGHSWGGILASEFEVRKQPPGLKRLILADSLAASSLWNQSNMQLLQAFPEDVQQGFAAGMKDPPKFWAALQKFHAVHGCIVNPFPTEFRYTMEQVFGPDGDPTVATAPILNNWTVIDRLHLVHASTLVVHGRKDIAQDFVVKPFFDKIQKVKWVTLENSSHTPFLEERERYMELVSGFLAL